MTTAAHHLVSVTRLWATSPTVVGIFETAEAAQAAVRVCQQDEFGPDCYSIETWRDRDRTNGAPESQ
ncbi:hypothetical protein [Rathayibacter sp. AY1D9]|uniref:hypothetical protein n=1 Tax=Rathayibacter sp. AY1D9 TaxID=2080548 RepID=UPI0011B0025F|nr:hypothetical protein [Rathayibacter sp. AY1D9]